MIFQRFEDKGLSQFSYAVGCEHEGEVVIVDPRRDVDVYLRFATDAGVRITAVTETHIHADYASGAAELARRAGAPLYLSGYDEGERYDASFPHIELRQGSELRAGRVLLRALHTPGHTPEHLAFLVYDSSDDPERPVRFLTGDFLFVGSLGRPDLLGEDAKRALADAMFDSIRRVLPDLPDDLPIHPGHGSGSMCGGGMSEAPESDLGEERRSNPFLAELERDEFVDRLLSSLPPYPEYYLRMKERNAGGVGFDRPWPAPVALTAERFQEELEAGAVAIDIRHQLAFGGGHIPDALGIGLDPDLSTWAGWVAPYERPLLLIADPVEGVSEAVTRLARVGLDRTVGYLDGGMDPWISAGRPLATIAQWEPETVMERLDRGLIVLDVRTAGEWEEGHIPGARHIMGGHLRGRLDELPDRDTEIAVICGSGYRSTVAASVLQRHGYTNVRNVPGGMAAWESAGLPLD
jgi:hydroxyacylglutathione hydrolase